jgi:hypothetical protein
VKEKALRVGPKGQCAEVVLRFVGWGKRQTSRFGFWCYPQPENWKSISGAAQVRRSVNPFADMSRSRKGRRNCYVSFAKPTGNCRRMFRLGVPKCCLKPRGRHCARDLKGMAFWGCETLSEAPRVWLLAPRIKHQKEAGTRSGVTVSQKKLNRKKLRGAVALLNLARWRLGRERQKSHTMPFAYLVPSESSKWRVIKWGMSLNAARPPVGRTHVICREKPAMPR